MASVRKRLSTKHLPIFIAFVVGFVGVGLAPAIAVEGRVIDVVSVTWSGASQLAKSVDEIATAIDTGVNPRWKSYTTLVGDNKDRVISFKTGKVLASPIVITSRMPCTGKEASSFIYTIRAQAYKNLGISDSSNRYLVIASPKAGCVWSGRAPLGDATSTSGNLVLHDSGSAFVITHELGHTFGLGHTNFLRCDSTKKDGKWGEDCKAVEYGSSIDVMGNVDTVSTLNTYHQWRMGYMDTSQVKQVWQSETVNIKPSDFANGLKAIYLRDGSAAYWIEYRSAKPELLYKAGLVIYRLDPPPISSIVSPNPEDTSATEFGNELGADVWMLNLDSYKYILSKSVGSMTSNDASLYSGNIVISAKSDATGAAVTITRKADTTPPPVPPVIDSSQWRYPSLDIIKVGYEDAETSIASFQISVDGKESDLPGTVVDIWKPTYLNPFTAPKSIFVRDLPEGSYMFSLRAIDLAGNKSPWTTPMKAVIDRGRPVITNDFSISSITGNEISLEWNGAQDSGSGICQTNLVNQDGYVTQSIADKPVIKLIIGKKIVSKVQVFDCIGNGLTGDFSALVNSVSADKSSRTGKWSAAGANYSPGALKCVGKCSASFSAFGQINLLVGTGSAVLTSGTSNLATIPDSKSAKMRVGANVDVGATKKVIRVTGRNFVLVGLATFSTSVTNISDFDRVPAVTDDSLTDPVQVALSKYGFNAKDFSQEWTVIPMENGTTLKDPTLDLCGAAYPSEKERVERRQMRISNVISPYSFLSSEVVRYSSTSAAQNAQKELVKALVQCQIDKGYKDATGLLVPYTFSEIKNIPSGLVGENSRVLVRATIDTGFRAYQLLGFYQYNGAIFTGLYAMTTSKTVFTDAQVANWLQVAVTMALRLKG